MTVDAVRAELAAVAREHERAADEWRTRALDAEAMLEDCEDERNRMVERALAAEAERDLLVGIIAKLDGTVTPDSWYPHYTDLKPAEADAVARILGEGER